MAPPLPSDPGLAAFGSSLTAITLAELGDKTFFMALILAARHSARLVFVGAFVALAAVTLLSLGVGYGLRELLPQSLVPWIAAVLFLGFGLKLLVDAQVMDAGAAREEAVTWLAVGAGKWIGGRVNEQLLYRLSGGLFLVFGLVSLLQALGSVASR